MTSLVKGTFQNKGKCRQSFIYGWPRHSHRSFLSFSDYLSACNHTVQDAVAVLLWG